MKIFLSCIFALLSLSSCGYYSLHNEGTGHVKKVVNVTPVICPNYNIVGITLGSSQSGMISVSPDWYVAAPDQQKVLKEAAETQKLIKFIYSAKRFTFCTAANLYIEEVEIVK